VPYTGSAGAVKDLTGGHVNAMFIPVHTVLPLAADNQVHLLALGSEQRSALAPDVPTLSEQGLSGFEVDLWYALSAPAGNPKDIIDRWRVRPPLQARARAGTRSRPAGIPRAQDTEARQRSSSPLIARRCEPTVNRRLFHPETCHAPGCRPPRCPRRLLARHRPRSVERAV
jgi:hypothetical protein